jgi:site-specific DNA-cytosine methylase
MFNAIGAHIYAGGFSVGVSKSFNVLCHLEHAAYGADVVRLNFPDLPIYEGGPAAWPLKWPRGADRPRFMYANPPCAIWSAASHGRTCHWTDDPRLQAHRDIFSYALDVAQVDVLTIESVPPSFTKGREHVDHLIGVAAEKGYSTTIARHDTRWLGVPQSRKRIFYIFHKVEIPWEFPVFDRPITVRQAFRGLPKKTRGYPVPHISEAVMNLLKLAKPGDSLQRLYQKLHPFPERNDRGHKIGSPSFLERRASWDAPAPVALSLYHPVECRQLNQEELAAICSFPPDYRWPRGGQSLISNYMNRGVMPKAGEWLAKNVASALTVGRRLNRPTTAVLDVTQPPGNVYDLQPDRTFVTVTLPASAEPQLPAPAVQVDRVPAPRVGTVIVDWSPRICGATTWCGHVQGGDPDIELMSFSRSGRPLASWESPFTWNARRISDAADILNDYDRVIMGDIVCFSPSIGLDAAERPYYIDILKRVTRRWTGIFHGGSYPRKHNDTIDAVLSSPGFCGTLLTPRLGQARERLARWPVRFEHTPYLPFDVRHAPSRRDARRRTKSALMTARVTSNKGQNAALLLVDHLNCDIDVWGCGQFGQPSPTWLIWELGTLGLGYKVIKEPGIRADKPTITHPNAKKFYTGAFELETPRGRRWRYREGYQRLDQIDWSPWIHLSLASPDFAGILEYSVIEAVHAGSIAVVPEGWPTEGKYKTIQTIPFESCTTVWDPGKNAIRETRSFDRAAVAKVINNLLKLSHEELAEIANSQYSEFIKLHQPKQTLNAIDRALSSGREIVAKRETSAAVKLPLLQPGEKSGAYIRRCLIAGFHDDDILASVHANFAGSKASKSDINWNKVKLRKEGTAFNGERPVNVAPKEIPQGRDAQLAKIGRALQDIGAVLTKMGE